MGKGEPMSDLFWSEETKELVVFTDRRRWDAPKELQGLAITMDLYVTLKLAREIFGARILSKQEARVWGIRA